MGINADGWDLMDWTPIGLIGIAVLTIADLLVFRMVFPPHTAENTILRIVNGLAWVFAVFLLFFGFAWILL